MSATVAHPETARAAARAPTAAPRDAADGAATARPRWARRMRAILGASVVAGLVAAAVSAPRWGPPALARFSYFRVRRVEVEGARLAAPGELVARLRADTSTSVWTDLAPLAARVRAHPLVADARVERRLPGVLVLRVTERVPVAMAPGASGVAFYDTAGRALPVPSAAAGRLDLPLVAAPDRALLRALGALRAGAPALFARVSEARAARGGEGGLVFALAPAPGAADGTGRTLLVRAAADVAPQRFGDVVPVERDLARRGVRPAELDLRFRDQVVARLP